MLFSSRCFLFLLRCLCSVPFQRRMPASLSRKEVERLEKDATGYYQSYLSDIKLVPQMWCFQVCSWCKLAKTRVLVLEFQTGVLLELFMFQNTLASSFGCCSGALLEARTSWGGNASGTVSGLVFYSLRFAKIPLVLFFATSCNLDPDGQLLMWLLDFTLSRLGALSLRQVESCAGREHQEVQATLHRCRREGSFQIKDCLNKWTPETISGPLKQGALDSFGFRSFCIRWAAKLLVLFAGRSYSGILQQLGP